MKMVIEPTQIFYGLFGLLFICYPFIFINEAAPHEDCDENVIGNRNFLRFLYRYQNGLGKGSKIPKDM